MIKESDMFREQKDLLEYQLEKLGVSTEKLRDAMKELSGDRGLCENRRKGNVGYSSRQKTKSGRTTERTGTEKTESYSCR